MRGTFVRRPSLREAGLVEGENVAIEYYWAENQIEPALTSDPVRQEVAVVFSSGGQARSARPSSGNGYFAVGDQLFQWGQVGEIFRMGLLHVSHERGADLIRHVKARRPFQRVDQHLVFRRLERPHHCRRQARIVADMTDRFGDVYAELYLNEPSDSNRVALFRHGTRVIEDLALLDDLAHPPWTLRHLQGHVDAPFVNLTPGTRSGLIHDTAYATLCENFIEDLLTFRLGRGRALEQPRMGLFYC